MTSEESHHWAAAVYCGSYSWMGKAILRNWGVHILINAYVLYDHAPSFIFLIFSTLSFGFCRSSRQRKRCAEVWKHCTLFGLHEAGWAHHWWLQICCFSYYTYWNTTLKSLTSVLFFPCLYILGLNYVEEVSVADPQGEPRFEPRYTCLLCRQNAPLTEMLRHLIGRKHRQKYLVKLFKHFFSPPGEPFSKCIPPFLFFRWN